MDITKVSRRNRGLRQDHNKLFQIEMQRPSYLKSVIVRDGLLFSFHLSTLFGLLGSPMDITCAAPRVYYLDRRSGNVSRLSEDLLSAVGWMVEVRRTAAPALQCGLEISENEDTGSAKLGPKHICYTKAAFAPKNIGIV